MNAKKYRLDQIFVEKDRESRRENRQGEEGLAEGSSVDAQENDQDQFGDVSEFK